MLEVRNLKTYFFTDEGVVKAVDGVSFSLRRGEVLGLVGESGCGKSVTALSIMGLLPPVGRVVDGEVLFQGEDLLKLPASTLQRMRGDRIAMIFQEPISALNPVFTVGSQIAETLMLHKGLSRKEAYEEGIALLERVGIPDPHLRMRSYPHQLSGGMRQRAMIAMAIACQPDLLIADEPTTALDVTIQAQILALLDSLREQFGMGIIFITHDLGVVAQVIVEEAGVEEIFYNPLHPYTRGLLAALPVSESKELKGIPGEVPDPKNYPPGCRFAPRCPIAEEACLQELPELCEVAEGHLVRCIKAGKDYG